VLSGSWAAATRCSLLTAYALLQGKIYLFTTRAISYPSARSLLGSGSEEGTENYAQ
jgi:hypothetical protein